MREATSAADLKHVWADLHIHTALSPCGADEMTPPAIVAVALAKGLGMIAVCDHNATGNIAAVQEAAGEQLTVLAGLELTTAEEVHVLGLFAEVALAEQVSREVQATLPPAHDGYSAFFGEQCLFDRDGRVTGQETAALALASGFTLNEAVRLIHEHQGLAVACHIDRPAFSVYSQLGFFPLDAGFDAVELSRHFKPDSPRREVFEALGLPITASSDSHFLEEIGLAATDVLCRSASFEELALAFLGVGGRGVARA